MKKFLMLFSLLVFVSVSTFSSTGPYRVDDNQIESLFSQAQTINLPASGDLLDFAITPGPSMDMVKKDKNPAVAFILAFFVGNLGIHRLYMGTATATFIGYILTCGGLGIVAFVDWIVLLIGLVEDDISKYIDNPKFFMWL